VPDEGIQTFLKIGGRLTSQYGTHKEKSHKATPCVKHSNYPLREQWLTDRTKSEPDSKYRYRASDGNEANT